MLLIQEVKAMSNAVPFKVFCVKYDLDPKSADAKEQYQSYSNNLDMFKEAVLIEEEKKNWGGSRQGAGRKTKYAATKVMRVPEKYEEAIKALIAHLDNTDNIDHNYTSVKSEGVFLRSLQDKKQNIFFITEPIPR